MNRQALALALLFGLTGCRTTTTGPDPGKKNESDEGVLDEAVAARIGDLFQRVMDSRTPAPRTGVKRAVFLKPHGCASAKFEIRANLPEPYKRGLFATPTDAPLDAWVRISSDTDPRTSDFENNTIGFAVKVLGVPGTKVLGGEEDATTHDFLTQNINVFFVDTAQDFLDFTEAAFAGSLQPYLDMHPTTNQILADMAKLTLNVLGTSFWSTTPYHFGADAYAKYKIIPCTNLDPEEQPAPTNVNYLLDRMQRDLAAHDACFELQVQLRQPEWPLDAQTFEWSEELSPPTTVATITIPAQDVSANAASCENLSFTAWHALPEHKPVGTVNAARGIIYKRLADYRRTRNHLPLGEPK